MKRYSRRFRLFATVALAAFALSTAPALAGPGKSGDHGGGGGQGKGGGKPSSDFFASKGNGGGKGKPVWTTGGGNKGKPSWAGGGKPGIEVEECVDGGDGGCDVDLAGGEEEDENIDLALGEEDEEDGELTGRKKGQVHASLKGLNGPVHASERAMERASDKSIIGQARIWRDSVLAEEAYTDKQEELAGLMEERSQERIQEEIDNLDPEDVYYASKLEALQDEYDAARNQDDINNDMNTVMGELDAMEDPEVLAANSGAAYSNLTDDRSLTDEAYDLLRSALGLSPIND